VTSETGRLVPLGDNHSLAKAVVDLLPQVERRQQLGRAGSARIHTHFSLDQMVEATGRLYDTVLES
jgi:glycosyltransferase involved in cell wall biosynthesis